MAFLFALLLTVQSPNTSAIGVVSSISIEKTGPDTAMVGETITYEFTVYNNGEVDLYIDVLDDNLLGDLRSYISDGIVTVDEGSEIFQVEYAVVHPELDPLVNTVNVEATDEFGENFTEDWDDHSVDILHPDVMIEKYGPPEAMVGESISYEIIVTNTGETDLYIDFIYDTILGDLTGDITDGVITTAEVSDSFWVEYQVQESDPDPLINEIDVQAYNEYWGESVYDVGFCETDIVYTGVTIDKDGPSSAVIGETIWYEITITNTGETDLYIDYLWDDLLGDLSSYLTNGIITVDDGYETIWVDYVVQGTDPSVLSNEVFVEASNEEAMDWVDDSDYHELDVLHTGVMIEKTGPSEATVGEEVEYIITVTNTGDADLYIMNIDDSLLGSLYGYISGGVITVAEHSETIYVYRTVLETDPNPLVNHVELNATNEYYEDWVWAEDDHSITIVESPSCGSICVFKYEDVNGNGVQDEGEPGLVDWEITLMDAAGAPITAAMTDGDGYVCFTDLTPGVYYVDETLQEGWYRTENASAVEVTVVSGEIMQVVFGNTEYVTVEIFKWEDMDGDLSTTDDRVPTNVSCDLWYEWGTPNQAQIWNGYIGPDGYIEFTGLVPGFYDSYDGIAAGWYAVGGDNYESGTAYSGDTLTFVFVNTQYVSVEIYKYEDTDGDITTTDDWEPVDVRLDLYGSEGEVFYGYIGSDGYILITGLVPDFYNSYEYLDIGWISLDDGYESGIAYSGDTLMFTFVNAQESVETGSICVFKYEDVNGNGVQDEGEPGLVDWEITLMDAAGAPIATAMTDGDGYACFPDLDYGTYYVDETLQEGWSRTENASAVEVTVDSEDIEQVIFGNWKWASICGVKINDLNGDGVINWGSEPAMNGWTIRLYKWNPDLGDNGDWELYDTQVTRTYEPGDPPGTYETIDGRYCFIIMEPGVYEVREVLMAGWTTTVPYLQMGDVVDTEAVIDSDLTFTSGEEKRGWHIANWEWASICGIKINDLNGDGEIDWTNEPEMNGWTINLYRWNDSMDDWEFVTSVETRTYEPPEAGEVIPGRYCFDIKEPGIYEIRECLKAGWTMTLPVLQVGDSMDTEAIVDSGLTFTSGEEKRGWHIANWEWMTISGHKYISETTTPLAGWHMQLIKDAVQVGADAVTDSNGYYEFLIKEPGTYDIMEVLQDRWTEISPILYYSAGDGSTISVLGYPGIAVVSGTDVTGKDFENFQWLTICGIKFNDHNGNGIVDWSSDNEMDGWTIKLYKDGECIDVQVTRTYLPEENPWGETIYGRYCFDIKEPGTYVIKEVLPTGWTMTIPAYQVGPEAGSVEVTGYTEVIPGTQSSTNITGRHFGNFEWMTICGIKINDLNCNGVIDWASEPEMNGWTIKLYKDGQEVDSTETRTYLMAETGLNEDIYGRYCFLIKEPGTYSIKEVLPAGWIMTYPYYIIGPDEGVEEVTGWTETVHSGVSLTGRHFANAETGSICIFKYEDVNGNGVYDADDVPLAGWHVYVEHDSYSVPSVDGYTNETGWFCVENVIPGIYWVGEYSDPDWMGIENGSGNSIMVTIMSGTSVEVWFGNAELISICGHKLEDTNLNGEFELGIDPGIEGWSIKLWYHDGMSWDVWGYIDTDENGYFCFEGLNPFWDYCVEEELRDEWTAANLYYHYLYPAGSGDDITGIEFLNARNISICGYKMEDIGLDGWSCDAPVCGWQIDLYGWPDQDAWWNDSASLGLTVYTDGDGKYCFENLNPYWIYNVQEEVREDWTPFTSALYVHLTAMGSGENITGINFLNARNINICGQKYEDVGLDGWGDDEGLMGWEIWITGYNETMVPVFTDYTVTGWSGEFCFDNLDPYLLYYVEEGLSTYWTPYGDTDYWLQPADYIVSGGTIEVSFLNAENIDICVWKYDDVGLDGWGCDIPVKGWVIELWYWDEDLECWLTGGQEYTEETDEAGRACFENLNPYLNYTVSEDLMLLLMDVFDDPWTPFGPTSYELISGVDFTSGNGALREFLNANNIDICGYKLEDIDLDGEGDVGVEGWHVFLVVYDPVSMLYVGDEYADTYTDENGHYCFENLNPYRWYMVYEEHPSDWTTSGDTYHWFHSGSDFMSGDVIYNANFTNARNIDLSACKYEDVNLNKVIDDEDVPVEDWRIDLYVCDESGEWVLIDSKWTGPCGCVAFENLDPYHDYMICEEMQEGWTPAPGWDTCVVFMHGVDFMSGYSYYGKGVVYGILRDTGDVYEIDILAGTSSLLFEMPTPPGANSASPNGLAFDAENGRIYYVDYNLGTTPDTLYFWDGITQHVAGQIAQGTVACADFYDGKYYYIPSGTDDLRAISFNPDGTIATDVKIDDISDNVHSWNFNGDIAVRDGMVYGWGLCGVSGHGYEFFTYDLGSGIFWFVKPSYQQSLQLAFGSDGVLYGHRAGTGGYFYAIDTSDASVTLVEPTPDPANQYTDIASGTNITGVNFLNARNASICGYKVEDVNLNKNIDDSVVWMGWEIDLYKWNGVEYVYVDTTSTIWDPPYTYCFEDLDPYGMYKVVEHTYSGHTPVISEYEDIKFSASGVNITNVNFLNAENIDICGYKLEDVDLDGVGDLGVEGWQIELFGYENETAWAQLDWSLHITLWTDADGHYCFTNLNPYWIYDVKEELNDTWTPAGPTVFCYIKAEYSGVGGMGDIIGVNFTNARNGCICGYKMEDVNLNGEIDGGDTPLAGWGVDLYIWDGYWQCIAATTTDACGMYCFCNLDPYRYYKVEEWQLNSSWVYVITGEDDLKISESGGTLCDMELTWFLNAEKGCICGYKMEDVNLNGEIDGGDTPLAGWGVDLYIWDGYWQCIAATTTDACGMYCFCNLDPYRYYKVEEWQLNSSWVYVITGEDDLKISESGGTLCDMELTWFLNAEKIDICVWKYEDLFLNGNFDMDDVAVEGWWIDLLVWNEVDMVWDPIAGGCTDICGMICFTDLDPYKNYKVSEEWQLFMDPDWVSGPGWDTEVVFIHGVDFMSGDSCDDWTAPIAIFLNARRIDLCAYKYEDINLNGILDDGDAPVENWWFSLYVWTGSEWDWIGEMPTCPLGCACFCGLDPYEDYKISEDPQLWWQAYELGLNDPWTPAPGWATSVEFEHGVDFMSNEDDCYSDCTYFLNAHNIDICSKKFDDLNLDGWTSPNEVVEGWNITLEVWCGDAWVEIAYGLTNEYGKVCFLNLNPYYDYRVVEEDREDWTHYSPTSKEIYSGVDFVSGDDYFVTHPVIFLNARNIDLCGYKLEDIDLDGVGDIGVVGWQIDLYGFEDWTSWASNVSDMHLTVWTDADGNYCFENLNPYWIYDVYEEVVSDWTAATPTYIWELMATGSGEDITGVNFTNARNIDICACKYEDVNLNGEIDMGDMTVEDWCIDLFMWDDIDEEWVLYDYEWTGECGCVCFENLNPYRDYMFSEEWQLAMDPDWMPAPGWATQVVLMHGEDFMSGDDFCYGDCVYFLNARLTDIGGPGMSGYKLEDLDLDGVGDVGVEGWQIDLYGYENETAWDENDWSLYLTTTTGADGSYFFANLNPYWIYDVYEETRSDWTPASPTYVRGLESEGSGQGIPGPNFTNARNIDICGCKWEDKDLSGTISPGDVTVAGWGVTLKVWNGDSYEFLACTTTGTFGCYCFQNLNPYMMYAVYEELRDTWTEVTYKHEWLTACGSGMEIMGQYFLNARNIDICGCKWEDKDLSGTISPGDVTVAGWGVTLKVWNGDSYEFLACTTTGTFGCYCFQNLNPYMMYAVYEELRDTWTEVTYKHEWLTACGSGVDILGQYLLNARNGDICGHKYWDKNADGIYDPCTETPLQGWTIKLYAWTCGGWVYCGQEETDCCGCYCFENLNPYLTYKVAEVVPDGWWPINPDDGVHCPINFGTSGQTICGVDFLNTQCGPEGKTIGFWKTNVGKNLGTIKGKAQISASNLNMYLGNIYAKYYVNLGYGFAFLNFDGMTQEQRLQKAWGILNVDDNSIMQLKAEAQILALLLTEQWKGSEYSDAFVYVPACITGGDPFIGDMSGVIQEILSLYGIGGDCYTQAKNMADFLNNLPDSCKWGSITLTATVPTGKPKK